MADRLYFPLKLVLADPINLKPSPWRSSITVINGFLLLTVKVMFPDNEAGCARLIGVGVAVFCAGVRVGASVAVSAISVGSTTRVAEAAAVGRVVGRITGVGAAFWLCGPAQPNRNNNNKSTAGVDLPRNKLIIFPFNAVGIAVSVI